MLIYSAAVSSGVGVSYANGLRWCCISPNAIENLASHRWQGKD